MHVVRIFRAGTDVRQIYDFNNGHTDFFPLVDVNGDGKFELQIFDGTFAYWKAGFASSPALSKEELRKKSAELDWAESQPEVGAPPQFWTDMPDLIGAGNADQLASYAALAWPSGNRGKSPFLAAFGQQLCQSHYWRELNALHGGKLEAAVLAATAAPVSARRSQAQFSCTPSVPLGRQSGHLSESCDGGCCAELLKATAREVDAALIVERRASRPRRTLQVPR